MQARMGNGFRNGHIKKAAGVLGEPDRGPFIQVMRNHGIARAAEGRWGNFRPLVDIPISSDSRKPVVFGDQISSRTPVDSIALIDGRARVAGEAVRYDGVLELSKRTEEEVNRLMLRLGKKDPALLESLKAAAKRIAVKAANIEKAVTWSTKGLLAVAATIEVALVAAHNSAASHAHIVLRTSDYAVAGAWAAGLAVAIVAGKHLNRTKTAAESLRNEIGYGINAAKEKLGGETKKPGESFSG